MIILNPFYVFLKSIIPNEIAYLVLKKSESLINPPPQKNDCTYFLKVPKALV